MIRNSTQKFKQKYRYSSQKKLETLRIDKQDSLASELSVRFNTSHELKSTKSTPKLENSVKGMLRTQPLISYPKQKRKQSGQQHNLYTTTNSELQTIRTLMKRRGVDDSQFQFLKEGKLKKTSRNRLMNRDSEEFIEQLPKNSLFFCSDCYQYVFEIQKRRHFPDCKEMLNKSQTDIIKIAVNRLEKLVELARYTETSTVQISELYEMFMRNEHKRLLALHYPKFNFFTLKQIAFSFACIYDQLLRNVRYANDSSFFTCF